MSKRACQFAAFVCVNFVFAIALQDSCFENVSLAILTYFFFFIFRIIQSITTQGETVVWLFIVNQLVGCQILSSYICNFLIPFRKLKDELIVSKLR